MRVALARRGDGGLRGGSTTARGRGRKRAAPLARRRSRGARGAPRATLLVRRAAVVAGLELGRAGRSRRLRGGRARYAAGGRAARGARASGPGVERSRSPGHELLVAIDDVVGRPAGQSTGRASPWYRGGPSSSSARPTMIVACGKPSTPPTWSMSPWVITRSVTSPGSIPASASCAAGRLSAVSATTRPKASRPSSARPATGSSTYRAGKPVSTRTTRSPERIT